MQIYKYVNNPLTGNVSAISITNPDGSLSFIPFDTANNDAANFLAAWKAGTATVTANAVPTPYSAAALAALPFRAVITLPPPPANA